MKSFYAVLTALLIGPAATAKGLTLAEDFEVQTKRGITFYFFAGPDEGIYLTLKKSTALFRYLDGTKADGSLQKRVDHGSFQFAKNRLVLHGDFLKKELTLSLEPFSPQNAVGNAAKARFLLASPEFPFGGYGPVDVSAKRRTSRFLIKEE